MLPCCLSTLRSSGSWVDQTVRALLVVRLGLMPDAQRPKPLYKGETGRSFTKNYDLGNRVSFAQ